MKLSITTLSIAVLIFAASCAPSLSQMRQERLQFYETERERILSEHPEWSQETVKTIKNGRINIGFTKDMVLAAYYHPSTVWVSVETNKTITEHGEREQWVFHNFKDDRNYMYVYFTDGKVSTVQK